MKFSRLNASSVNPLQPTPLQRLYLGLIRHLHFYQFFIRLGNVGKLNPAALLPYDTMKERNFLAEQEAEEQARPGVMVEKCVVVFRRGFPDFRQTIPRK